MKGIIVDDEAKGRSMLQALCEEYCEGLEIVGQAASVDEAIEVVARENPQLVFLDIHMPVKNGFQLLEAYEGDPPFSVVFTTAYDQYALQAFKSSAIDYLLKPIDIDALTAAVEKAQRRHRSRDDSRRLAILKEVLEKDPINKIALTTLDGFTFVSYEDIVRCEAQGNYTDVVLADGSSLLITKTLKHYEEILNGKDFFRVHKSHLINLNCVRRFVKGKQGLIEMTDGQLIEVSLRKKEALLERLSNR